MKLVQNCWHEKKIALAQQEKSQIQKKKLSKKVGKKQFLFPDWNLQIEVLKLNRNAELSIGHVGPAVWGSIKVEVFSTILGQDSIQTCTQKKNCRLQIVLNDTNEYIHDALVCVRHSRMCEWESLVFLVISLVDWSIY